MQGATVTVSVDSSEAADLVARARAGEFPAFEALYARHVGRVHAICLRMTGDVDRAEELTQDAFVRAWRKLDLLRTDEGFEPWLVRLAVNVVRSDRRVFFRRRGREQPLDDRIDQATASARRPTAGASIDLEQALRGLPERARHVFVLHDVEGYGHEEIADLLNVKTGTSKSQLHRARKLLREALQC
jgi:RNA polymerase sigma-70 factor (ECF subfamily)